MILTNIDKSFDLNTPKNKMAFTRNLGLIFKNCTRVYASAGNDLHQIIWRFLYTDTYIELTRLFTGGNKYTWFKSII